MVMWTFPLRKKKLTPLPQKKNKKWETLFHKIAENLAQFCEFLAEKQPHKMLKFSQLKSGPLFLAFSADIWMYKRPLRLNLVFEFSNFVINFKIQSPVSSL